MIGDLDGRCKESQRATDKSFQVLQEWSGVETC